MLDSLKRTHLFFRRPKLTIKDIDNDEKMDKLISWFLTKEKGLIKRISQSKLPSELMMLSGYTPIEIFKEGKIIRFSESADPLTLSDYVKQSIRGKIGYLKEKGGGEIFEKDFKQMLDVVNDNCVSYVKFILKFDSDSVFSRIFYKDFMRAGLFDENNPILKEVQNSKYLGPLLPDNLKDLKKSPLVDILAGFSNKQKRAWVSEEIRKIVQSSKENQIIATQIISKTFLEIIAYILAWLYYTWWGIKSGKQYYYPPFSNTNS